MTDAALDSMSLQAVTAEYGESGLRDRFAREIDGFDPADRTRLERALGLASRLHRHDRRIREPYVNHLLRVAIRIRRYYQVSDVDVLVAALLHDSAEDHPAELAGGAPQDPTGAAFGVLTRDFGPRVAGLVRSVTNPTYDAERDEHEQYREHVAHSLDADPWARVIKVSDFTDNGVSVVRALGPKAYRWAVKYRPLVPVLRELVARPDTPLTSDVKQHIFDQLDLAEERFRAILG